MINIGIIAIMIAAICAALHYKFNEYLKDYRVLNRLFWQFLIGILMVTLFFRNVNYNDVSMISPIGWFYILLLVVIAGIGAYGFMIISVNKVGATLTGALDYLEPVIGVILAMIVFGENLIPIQYIGWIMILFSLFGIGIFKKYEYI